LGKNDTKLSDSPEELSILLLLNMDVGDRHSAMGAFLDFLLLLARYGAVVARKLLVLRELCAPIADSSTRKGLLLLLFKVGLLTSDELRVDPIPTLSKDMLAVLPNECP
jgi:hypothetical protein